MCETNKLRFSRRKFLRSIAAATCASLGQRILMPAKDFMAFGAIGSNDKSVIFLHMGGGWSLNNAPPDHGTFRDKMAPIYPASSLVIGPGDQFLHPSLVKLHTRYQQGQLLVCNKVRDESANYSRSHEDATEIYLSGLLNPSIASSVDVGLGARIACLDPGNSLAAISFAGSDTWASGNCNSALSIDNLDNLGERAFRWSTNAHLHFTQARDAVHATATLTGKPRETFVRGAIDNVGSTLAAVEGYKDLETGVDFPNTSLGDTMRNIAQIIIGQQSSSIRTAAFLASMGGYDTHSGELNTLSDNLETLDNALDAFLVAMSMNNLLDRVAIIIFGEFGRTFSNGAGTDHGASQRVFVLGGRVNGGRVANSPESAAECAGQYVTAYDFSFRSLFRQFIEGGLGISGASVFPEALSSGDNLAYLFK